MGSHIWICSIKPVNKKSTPRISGALFSGYDHNKLQFIPLAGPECRNQLHHGGGYWPLGYAVRSLLMVQRANGGQTRADIRIDVGCIVPSFARRSLSANVRFAPAWYFAYLALVVLFAYFYLHVCRPMLPVCFRTLCAHFLSREAR